MVYCIICFHYLLLVVCNLLIVTLQGTNISPKNGMFEDDFPFPKVGYVNFLEGNCCVFLYCVLFVVVWVRGLDSW